MSKRLAKTKCSCKIDPGPDVRINLQLEFDGDKVGIERTNRVWEHLGKMLAAALEPDQRDKFLAAMNSELERVTQKMREAAESHCALARYGAQGPGVTNL